MTVQMRTSLPIWAVARVVVVAPLLLHRAVMDDRAIRVVVKIPSTVMLVVGVPSSVPTHRILGLRVAVRVLVNHRRVVVLSVGSVKRPWRKVRRHPQKRKRMWRWLV
jgi:hypothetical protein